MKSIATKITIAATPDQIWETLLNFQDYPNWNPFIVELKGKPTEGARLEAHLKLGKQSPQVFKPEVLVVQHGKEFRWRGKLFIKGLFDGEHYFMLKELPDGQTEFIHGETFSGILSGPIMRMIKEETVKGFERMNKALQEKVLRKKPPSLLEVKP